MQKVFITLIIVVFVALPARANDSLSWKDDVGGWHIRIDPSMGNGCFMGTLFEGGTYFRVALDMTDDPGLWVFVHDSDWASLEVGKLYPVKIQFGRLEPWTGDAVGWQSVNDDIYLALSIQEDRTSDFLEELQRMLGVTIQYEGNVIANLSLRGSYAAVDEMVNCQIAVRGWEDQNDDPFRGRSANQTDPFL